MTFHIITIFPKIFDSYFNESIIKRALKKDLINIKVHNLRDWTSDLHKTVDDSPFGGGAGMVMKIEPLYRALRDITLFNKGGRLARRSLGVGGGISSKTILLSAKGKTWNQQKAKKYSKLKNVILICGRYEGVDERITKFIDEEISIGDYILTGGEIGALTIIDSITRLLPGALGNSESAKNESHAIPGILEHPQYTRPKVFFPSPLTRGARGVLTDGKFKSYRVPKILLSGHHKKIEEWRKKHNKHSLPPLTKSLSSPVERGWRVGGI